MILSTTILMAQGRERGFGVPLRGGIEEILTAKATLKCHIKFICHDHRVPSSIIFQQCWGVGLFLTLFPILKTRVLFLICLARVLCLPGNARRMISERCSRVQRIMALFLFMT